VTDVTVHGLTKRYGALTAVDDLTFELRAGRVTAFLGPNGAGKTTTLRLLLGLARPTAGRALIGGRPYAELPRPRRVVGAVLEDAAVHPGRRGRDHLRILARSADASPARVAEVLETVGLADAADRRVGGYSLGMRQRLAVAGALLGDPDVLVLDEPANGLDPGGMAWLRGLLRERAAAGHTVVLSSHVLSEVAQTVDDVVVLHGGVLRYAGPLDALAGDESLEAAFLRLTEAVPA
jgi:ABC-2 type transport system ATP-binding protein